MEPIVTQANTSGKTDATFLLADSLSLQELQKDKELAAGYDFEEGKWELIIKYYGDISGYANRDVSFEILTGGYAIATITGNGWEYLNAIPEITYIEKPRPFYEQTEIGQESACISPVKDIPYGLSGKGILIAIIDSGIDIYLPNFRNTDGTTRILSFWEQNARKEQGNSLSDVKIGREFTQEEIDAILSDDGSFLQTDISGHGTAVASIAAAGRANDYEGVAPESSLLIVKLRKSLGNPYVQSADIMRALDYVSKKAKQFQQPLVINLSYGTVWGAHRGDSLLERFIDVIADEGKTCIVTGTGNEAASGIHYSQIGGINSFTRIDLSVGRYDFGFALHIFYPGQEIYRFEVVTADGERINIPYEEGIYEAGVRVNANMAVSTAKPYMSYSEIYVRFSPVTEYLPAGGWYLLITPVKVITGDVNIYLSSAFSANAETRFVRPESQLSLTVPATSERIISTGAYSLQTNAYAAFSGRGIGGLLIEQKGLTKPDLLAPGVDIRALKAGGGYTFVTGTSFAAPFVTGAAALLMEWGIVRNNDPYLYGERLKALLTASARRPAFEKIPNERYGWGMLCLKNFFHYREILF